MSCTFNQHQNFMAIQCLKYLDQVYFTFQNKQLKLYTRAAVKLTAERRKPCLENRQRLGIPRFNWYLVPQFTCARIERVFIRVFVCKEFVKVVCLSCSACVNREMVGGYFYEVVQCFVEDSDFSACSPLTERCPLELLQQGSDSSVA